jgi:hypothetical protein
MKIAIRFLSGFIIALSVLAIILFGYIAYSIFFENVFFSRTDRFSTFVVIYLSFAIPHAFGHSCVAFLILTFERRVPRIWWFPYNLLIVVLVSALSYLLAWALMEMGFPLDPLTHLLFGVASWIAFLTTNPKRTTRRWTSPIPL